MFNYFLEETPWEIREQILRYNAAQNMSDVERAKFFGLPEGCRMREGAKIIHPQNLKIGSYCWIGENAILDASGGLEIGEHTSIGVGVFVWTHDSHDLNIKGENTRDASNLIKRRKTSIGKNCYIVGHSVIMPGVTIGDKCIVAPMSVVYEDLPNGTVYKPYRNFYKILQEIEEKDKKINDLERRISFLEVQLLQNE